MNPKIWMAPVFLAAGLALAGCGAQKSTSVPLVPASHNPTQAATKQFPAACYPLTSKGKCYQPGQQCKKSQYNTTGVGTNGLAITCYDFRGKWEWSLS
jgi:hypothetical protein